MSDDQTDTKQSGFKSSDRIVLFVVLAAAFGYIYNGVSEVGVGCFFGHSAVFASKCGRCEATGGTFWKEDMGDGSDPLLEYKGVCRTGHTCSYGRHKNTYWQCDVPKKNPPAKGQE